MKALRFLGHLTLMAGLLTGITTPTSARAETPVHHPQVEPSRADLAVAELSMTNIGGVVIYPRGTGPQGVVSFTRYSLAVPLTKDEHGEDKVCLRPGITPDKENPSFGVSVQVSF